MVTLSPSFRDLILDAYDVAFATGAKLELLGDGGTVLATFEVPPGAWTPASGGTKKLKEPLKTYALGTGIARSYVLSAGAHTETGTVGQGEDADMALDNTSLLPGTMVTVSTFTKVA